MGSEEGCLYLALSMTWVRKKAVSTKEGCPKHDSINNSPLCSWQRVGGGALPHYGIPWPSGPTTSWAPLPTMRPTHLDRFEAPERVSQRCALGAGLRRPMPRRNDDRSHLAAHAGTPPGAHGARAQQVGAAQGLGHDLNR